MTHSTPAIYIIVLLSILTSAILGLLMPTIVRLITLIHTQVRAWYLYNPRLDTYYSQLKSTVGVQK